MNKGLVKELFLFHKKRGVSLRFRIGKATQKGVPRVSQVCLTTQAPVSHTIAPHYVVPYSLSQPLGKLLGLDSLSRSYVVWYIVVNYVAKNGYRCIT